MKYSLLTLAVLATFAFTPAALAYSGDLSINSTKITFSESIFLEGRTVRIYATAVNNSGQDLLGVVRFFDNGTQIGGDQAISLLGGKTDDIFISWSPKPGSHKIAAKIFPWEPGIDNPANNWVVAEVFVVQDTDHDGIPNDQDDDDDGDGTPDKDDAFPLNKKEQRDTDGDGQGDNTDTDDDNDGVPDTFDDMPLDPNETLDSDKDGIGNIADEDDDGDGLKDTDEEKLKTDPLKPDTDGDKALDGDDAFPLDPQETLDTDKDGIGNNTDTDDDNDGIADTEDKFPLNKGPIIKLKNNHLKASLFEKFSLDASPSYDEDGEIVSFNWDIAGTLHEGNNVPYTFEKPGIYRVSLTVTDDQGESRNTEFQINVLNTRFYTQLLATFFVILLAMVLIFKYIAVAKNK